MTFDYSAEETIQFAKSKLKIKFIPAWKWLLEQGQQNHAPTKKTGKQKKNQQNATLLDQNKKTGKKKTKTLD